MVHDPKLIYNKSEATIFYISLLFVNVHCMKCLSFFSLPCQSFSIKNVIDIVFPENEENQIIIVKVEFIIEVATLFNGKVISLFF